MCWCRPCAQASSVVAVGLALAAAGFTGTTSALSLFGSSFCTTAGKEKLFCN